MLKTTKPIRPKAVEDLLSPQLISRLDPLDLSSKRIFFGKLKGERRSKRRGQSVEFADHRAYVIGDDIRHIDWNIYARLDSLFLKLFLEEEDLSLSLVLDCSASCDTGEPPGANKFLFMQRACAALGYVGLVNLNRVSVTAIGEAESGVVGAIRDLRGRRRLHDLCDFLCKLQPAGGTRFKEACERIALTRRGKGLMIVFSDFLLKEGYEEGLRRLVGHGYDVYCVQVLSPDEENPTIVGDLRLKDVEDADTAEVTISAPLLKRYKATLAAYCQQLSAFCLRRDMHLLTVRSDTPVEVLILDYLRRKGVVR
jgi:uncharacterized protein (DUF58 family)